MSTARTTSARTGLDCRLLVQRPGFVLDLALTASPGQVLALLGPNGAGKSTALRTLAGLIRPDGGRTVLVGAVVEALGHGRRIRGGVWWGRTGRSGAGVLSWPDLAVTGLAGSVPGPGPG